jgi:DNA-binding LacI/PurR family transcriptional regulator
MPTRRVAMVFIDLMDRPQTGYARGIRDALPDPVKLIPYDTRRDPAREAACLREIEADNAADAVVCYALCAPENTRLFVSLARKIPVVFVDRIPGNLAQHDFPIDAVMTDNAGSVRSGLELLRSRGHERIAYFAEDAAPFISSVSERLAGYRQFMRETQGTDGEPWIRRLPKAVPVPVYFAHVQEYLEELLRGPQPITAVCCQQDKLLAAALEACVRMGIAVPDELEIVSFSDLELSLLPMGRSVHRLVQRSAEMGSIAARRLMMRLDDPDLSPQVMRLLADLHPATVVNGPRSHPRFMLSHGGEMAEKYLKASL